ncbi:glycosyltransferase family 2 protein [uncultured Polaribacter sp.]|uniref:glycosyltransferase family 2 protein n=1 Tax=uncultured Polaribacter sp. TaxID=174711 RepID=UPI0030DB34B6|tara:strand:+ start:27517 stop:28362 length:846 start_codon:yes stop_codon:yes gene_type:complete
MKFSVIIATLNRVEEPLLMLDSLVGQTYKNFEVILVDQNEDGKLDKHIKTYKDKFPLKHIKTEIKGASNARNTGINKSIGEILTFPDDDCEFYESFLEEINNHFNNSKNDGILITTKDKYDGTAISILMSSKAQKITKKNVLKTVIEAGIIVKSKKLDGVLFDPEMGVGSPTSPYWSDEGPDLILRLLEKGLDFEFCPQFYMFHPNPVRVYNEKTAIRSFRYGKGRGYLLKKHNFGFLSILYYLLIYMVGMLKGILMLNTKMFKYFRKGFQGRYEGYFLSK